VYSFLHDAHQLHEISILEGDFVQIVDKHDGTGRLTNGQVRGEHASEAILAGLPRLLLRVIGDRVKNTSVAEASRWFQVTLETRSLQPSSYLYVLSTPKTTYYV
jgi:hypothetical protein